MTMNDSALQRLKDAATNATPGPWPEQFKYGDWENYVVAKEADDASQWVCTAQKANDAAYIAAASPDVILALIAENERLKEAIRDIQNRAISVFCAGAEFKEAAYGIANDDLDKDVKIKQLEKRLIGWQIGFHALVLFQPVINAESLLLAQIMLVACVWMWNQKIGAGQHTRPFWASF